MKIFALIITFILFSILGYGQVKEKFQEQLKQDSLKSIFEKKIIQLDIILKNGVVRNRIDSLKEKGKFDFLDSKLMDSTIIIVFDLNSDLKDAYYNLERNGKVENLKFLRENKQLRIIARGIASEIEPPKKTNRQQSYTDFYLEVIIKILKKNKDVLKADKLDFPTYQSWEKEAGLKSEMEIRDYRSSFIIFLLKQYNLTY